MTWVLCFILTDFIIYLAHRAFHGLLKVFKKHKFFAEIDVLWAFHQMHHSSEYFNLSVAFRHAMPFQWGVQKLGVNGEQEKFN
jgi:sterol desaturase/sphingolipid hydroxylase (fatty acid hydroxylase superfamily)